MFVQKSDAREKELANDVSVRNQILSIESYSTNLFQSFYETFLQTSYVREKELADDVSARNLILSVHEVLKTCPYLFYFLTYYYRRMTIK